MKRRYVWLREQWVDTVNKAITPSCTAALVYSILNGGVETFEKPGDFHHTQKDDELS
ncbi:MAG: hypothetical protein ACQEQO_09120 [Thermodesulfobacteriota bacterium]